MLLQTEQTECFCTRHTSYGNSKSLLLFLFHGTEFRVVFSSAEWVQNGIPRVFFCLCSMLQNSEHFSPLRKGSEQNSESFLFRGTHRILSEQTNCSVYSVFRRIIFLSEIANPNCNLRIWKS
jgi:hypothetical protein